MKPKDLVAESLEKEISPKLEKFGFKFSKSFPKFSRKWRGFTQTIGYSLSKWNRENISVEFWTSFGISSRKYFRWHLDNYGEKPPNDNVAGEVDWNLEGWNYPKYNSNFRDKFEISRENDRERVLNILSENIINLGIPFLEKYSNWDLAADRLIKKNLFYSKASDFYLLAEKKEKAYDCLIAGKKLSWKQFPDEPARIDLRLKKHFNIQIKN